MRHEARNLTVTVCGDLPEACAFTPTPGARAPPPAPCRAPAPPSVPAAPRRAGRGAIDGLGDPPGAPADERHRSGAEEHADRVGREVLGAGRAGREELELEHLQGAADRDPDHHPDRQRHPAEQQAQQEAERDEQQHVEAELDRVGLGHPALDAVGVEPRAQVVHGAGGRGGTRIEHQPADAGELDEQQRDQHATEHQPHARTPQSLE